VQIETGKRRRRNSPTKTTKRLNLSRARENLGLLEKA